MKVIDSLVFDGEPFIKLTKNDGQQYWLHEETGLEIRLDPPDSTSIHYVGVKSTLFGDNSERRAFFIAVLYIQHTRRDEK